MATNEIENPTTLHDIKNEIKERGENFRSRLEGDIGEGKEPTIAAAINERTEPFVKGFEDQMRSFGIDTPEEAARAVQNNPLLADQAKFASANMEAIAWDAAAKRAAQFDAGFQKLCPAAYDRNGKLRPEAREDAVAYLRDKGWDDARIEAEWDFGSLRHPVNATKLYAKSRQHKADQVELKKLSEKRKDGWSSPREAARYRSLKGI
jgi:hypothetical protein